MEKQALVFLIVFCTILVSKVLCNEESTKREVRPKTRHAWRNVLESTTLANDYEGEDSTKREVRPETKDDDAWLGVLESTLANDYKREDVGARRDILRKDMKKLRCTLDRVRSLLVKSDPREDEPREDEPREDEPCKDEVMNVGKEEDTKQEREEQKGDDEHHDEEQEVGNALEIVVKEEEETNAHHDENDVAKRDILRNDMERLASTMDKIRSLFVRSQPREDEPREDERRKDEETAMTENLVSLLGNKKVQNRLKSLLANEEFRKRLEESLPPSLLSTALAAKSEEDLRQLIQSPEFRKAFRSFLPLVPKEVVGYLNKEMKAVADAAV